MSTRVPTKTEEFNTYITSTDDYLRDDATPTTKNWERLELSTANATDWHNKRLDWVELYTKFSNPNTRTTAVTKQVQTFKKDFSLFAAGPLDKISGSDFANEKDALTFHLVLTGKHKKPTHPDTPIADQCVLTVTPLTGATYKLTFRTTTDTGRASIPEGADCIILALQTGGTAPANAEDMGEKMLLTEATHTLEVGLDKIGEKLYAACRWSNTKHQNLAGPWSGVFSLTIA